jgi:hypothetical protein
VISHITKSNNSREAFNSSVSEKKRTSKNDILVIESKNK